MVVVVVVVVGESYGHDVEARRVLEPWELCFLTDLQTGGDLFAVCAPKIIAG